MRWYTLVPIVALVAAAQVCCCINLIGGPQPPYPVTPSDQAIERFKERWRATLEGIADGSVSITVSEEELTSLAVKVLEEQADLPEVSNLQILLRNGRIEAYATIRVNDALSVPGMAAFAVTVVDGRLNVALDEMDFGPLSLPQQVIDTLTARLNKLITESIKNEVGAVTISDVQIGNGEMTITGQLAPAQ